MKNNFYDYILPWGIIIVLIVGTFYLVRFNLVRFNEVPVEVIEEQPMQYEVEPGKDKG